MYRSTLTKYTHTYPVQIYIPVAAMALQGLESDFHWVYKSECLQSEWFYSCILMRERERERERERKKTSTYEQWPGAFGYLLYRGDEIHHPIIWGLFHKPLQGSLLTNQYIQPPWGILHRGTADLAPTPCHGGLWHNPSVTSSVASDEEEIGTWFVKTCYI